MTIISNPVTGPVVGQPISPNFGVQSAGAIPANAAIAIPAGMSTLEACGKAILPINALVTSVNGISTGTGDFCSVAELLSTGNGNQSMRGSPVAPSGGINDQQFVAGTSAATLQVNGPTQTNTEPQTLGPVSGAILGSNVTLTPNGFGG